MNTTSRRPRRSLGLALAAALTAGVTAVATQAAPSAVVASTEVVFDDMEHGNPFANGWFAFGGSVGGGGIDPNSTDLPPGTAGSYSLQTGWGSGGNSGFFGGFGRTNPVDLTDTAHFNFWINPDPGQDYTLEINLQDDDNGDGAINPPDDDEFQFNCEVSDTGPCAVSGGGWQLVTIPLADFFDDGSFLFGGNGVLDPVPTSAGGNGQLINVVMAVISNSGADVTFRTDDWTFTDTPRVLPTIIDDFESGLPYGTDGDGIDIGWYTFSDGSPVSIDTTTTPPAPVPGSASGNTVMQMDANVTAYAGFIHGFENPAVDTWVSQDWSKSEGFAVWIHGQNSGTRLFIDLLENRNPGSTTDDAERWTVEFDDDFSGWQYFEFPFSEFRRKGIGNGAPNDGLTLFEVHGWAFGAEATGGATTYYLDDASIYGVGTPPDLAVGFATAITEITEGTTGEVTVKLNRPITDDDPAEVRIDYTTEPGTAEPGRDYTPTSGTLTFVKDGATEQTFSLETFGDDKFLGNTRVVLRLTNPVDVERALFQGSAIIVDDDPYDPRLVDDFEFGAYLFDQTDVSLDTIEVQPGDALELPGQGRFENILDVTTPVLVEAKIPTGKRLCNRGRGVVPVKILSTDYFDATTIDHTTVRFGDASEAHVNKRTGEARRHANDVNGDGRRDLVLHFRFAETGYDCSTTDTLLTGSTFDGQPILTAGFAEFGRDFVLPEDWTRDQALRFWYHGTGSGDEIGVTLKDNAAPDPGPEGWELAWADEFNEAAGTPPNPANWTHEIGDVTPDGKDGWGNSELQYYTDDPANAATDGDGNLVITLREADGSQECYYGTCEFTSARLLSWHKSEFAYGRVESRLKVPGEMETDDLRGLWPAFWSLGTDIDRNPWPQAGEIDIMEWVGRIPTEIFGTIHGPGYAGGDSFGNTYDFGVGVFNDYHTFVVEWEPEEIRWYVDDILYHTATPADVAPNEWVFDKPFFLLLNFAIGGNFGGEVGDAVTYPQEYLVDYVRLYEAPDSAERFEASFRDDFTGWQEVTVPFTSFTRSADQPDGAPDDGLGLDEVWGYGFSLPEGGTASGAMYLDQVRREPVPAPTEIVVTNLDDSGVGSLRDAVGFVADGGTITFDPALAGGTISLTSGPIVLDADVSIDGSAAPGITLDGLATDRVLIVDAGATADVSDLTFTNGYGYQLGGCVLNNGALTLDQVTVTSCLMTTDAGDFWQGGGGIYNGEGASLDLVDSTVSNNDSGFAGGGVYSFFGTTTNVVRSTISGNTATDVGGGMRTLGNVTVDNSTLSGNEAVAWHGGAMFVTDGVADVTNSTVTDNTSPGGTAGGLFVGTFGDSSATLNVQNTIVAANGDFGCFLAPFGGGAVALNSLGNNVFSDGSCNPVASDQVVSDALLDVLADNGGPTQTHALLAGSPAIDAADAAACPATDQRGVPRPQGVGCDVGAYELE